jgi:hypothetical protein
MISAFGVEHMEFSKTLASRMADARKLRGGLLLAPAKKAEPKGLTMADLKRKPKGVSLVRKARRGPGVTRGRRDPNTSMRERGGKGTYYQPTPEQVRAARVRRSAQKANAYNQKWHTPHGGGGKAGFAVHRAASGRSLEAIGAATLIGGGALTALHHRTKVNKADKEKRTNVALGATAGGGAAFTGFAGGGHAVKATLKERRAARGETLHEKKVWAAHTKQYPSTRKNTRYRVTREKGQMPKVTPPDRNYKTYTKYPKGLPDWRLQRALGHKNRPGVAAAVVGSGLAAGAAFGAHRTEKKRQLK